MPLSYADSVCDCFSQVGGSTTLFAKSSDRPATEPQLVVAVGARQASAICRTQYLEIPGCPAEAAILAQPTWLWGAEHGVNASGVAIGNEKVYTASAADPERPGLIGMDLVRLGLERSRTADEAMEVMVDLLERWGQSGIADAHHAEAYHSSFLIVDPHGGWTLETSGATWAARRVAANHAQSNRISLADDWERGSSDLEPGCDLDVLRDPTRPTDSADGRLAATTAAVAGGRLTPAEAMAVLRDHGRGPWGAVGGEAHPAPAAVDAAGRGATVCMHRFRDLATTSSMVCVLGDQGIQRLWMAPGAPCVAPFLPAAIVDGVPVVPDILGALDAWSAMARWRVAAEGDDDLLERIRGLVGPLEAELLGRSLELGPDLGAWRALCEDASRQAAEVVARVPVPAG